MPSISVSKGEGSLNHNNRKFKTANVDPSRTHLNIILKKPCQKVLQNAYHELFDNALQKYNGRQKRDDRKIKNYLSHIQNSNQEKPFHEVVVQIGNKDNTRGLQFLTGRICRIIRETKPSNESRGCNRTHGRGDSPSAPRLCTIHHWPKKRTGNKSFKRQSYSADGVQELERLEKS